MDYSNESFEKFQSLLKENYREDSLVWLIRDDIFNQAFYGHKKRSDILSLLPLGWLVMFCLEWLRGFMKRVALLEHDESADICMLFVSPRNNHINRLYPLFKEMRLSSKVDAVCLSSNIFDCLDENDRKSFHLIEGQWTRFFQTQDLVQSSAFMKDLSLTNMLNLNRLQRFRLRVYLIEFFAWRRFWECRITEQTNKIVSSFEKGSCSKAMFWVAKNKKIPHRIHWLHGLRHASLQATLATELWCMTPGDVRYFSRRIPADCVAKIRVNPEAEALVREIGVLNLDSYSRSNPLHFLFLGPGLEASYSKSMRTADMEIIRKAQVEFGERISWRFRPHPSAVDRFREELEEVGINIEDFSIRELNEDLKWTHAVGSSWSSLLLDVKETGRLIFWVQAEIRTLGSVDELIADGVGVHLDKQSVVAKLTSLLNE